MLMILLSTECHQASDLWQQLELASELESDLQNTAGWGRKWLVDFNVEKTQKPFPLPGQITLILLIGKWMGLSLPNWIRILHCLNC